MNRICPICSKPYNIMRLGGTEEYLFCEEDQLYMCPNASMPDAYKDTYGLHYKLYANTEFSRKLNRARWKFIQDNIKDIDILLDFGCGAGAFASERPDHLSSLVISYDPYFLPNENAVVEVVKRGLDVITFWDSFEHLRRIEMIPLLGARYLVLGIPIFKDGVDITCWKHFRPDEHVWCFSEVALCRLMHNWGYEKIVCSTFEIELGRKDIYAYIFKNSTGRK